VVPVQLDDSIPLRAARGVLTRRVAAVALAAGVAVAAGCSMVGRLGYDNLPTLATWRADSYLSLNAEQKAIASRRIEALHAWHRSTQLDDYAALLREIQRTVAQGDVDEARIRAWRLAMFERWKPIADRAAPAVAEVAVTRATTRSSGASGCPRTGASASRPARSATSIARSCSSAR
jgi:hypothetical protein